MIDFLRSLLCALALALVSSVAPRKRWLLGKPGVFTICHLIGRLEQRKLTMTDYQALEDQLDAVAESTYPPSMLVSKSLSDADSRPLGRRLKVHPRPLSETRCGSTAHVSLTRWCRMLSGRLNMILQGYLCWRN